tara:strand:+ start:532 stop:942 length:411 start_codon:yes stop_codon:yes gene_type:complete
LNKQLVEDRLKMLVTLCDETEPDIPDDKGDLFSGMYMTAHEMLDRIEDRQFSWKGFEIQGIMEQANRIWKVRNKIKNGEWDDLEHTIMMHEIEDLIRKNQKIAAIKEYRKVVDCTLREAKDFVDSIQASLVGKLKH